MTLFATRSDEFSQMISSAFGADEARWFNEEVTRAWDQIDADGGADYSDNFRMALMGDAEAEAAYFEAQSNGCCGSMEHAFGPSPAGKIYLYGFNYGH